MEFDYKKTKRKMPGEGPRAKHWSFTLNNFTPDDIKRLTNGIDGVDYIIFGKEIGTSGTPHLQGTVCFQSRKRLAQVKETIGKAHCTVTRYLTQSIEYCKKDGDYTELGTVPLTGQKGEKRSDIEEFKRSVKEGVTCMVELRELHSNVCAMYPRFVKEYINDCREKVMVEPHPLRDWQAKLYNTLKLKPDNREIIFVIDRKGNEGKSWFARYYNDLHPSNSQIIIPGKKADMAYIVEETTRVFFFDCPRSKQGDFIQYDFLEEVKNGYILSGKYESMNKKIKVPHIVVLMNEKPDMYKLSADRYKIIELS